MSVARIGKSICLMIEKHCAHLASLLSSIERPLVLQALRMHGLVAFEQVECMILETTGVSIFPSVSSTHETGRTLFCCRRSL